MKKQFAKYPFNPAGVLLWQADLLAEGASTRNAEASLVESSLYSFVPLRFTLEPGQVAFLDSLPPALCHLWATQIAYAIREQLPIELVKPAQNPADEDDESAKFIEAESRAGSQAGQYLAAEAECDGSYHLRFTIGY